MASALLVALLVFRKMEHAMGVRVTKPTLSLLFVIVAFLQPRPLPGYFPLILAGLIFCLGGDVALLSQKKKIFLVGIALFLVGHVFYSVAFFTFAGLGLWTGIAAGATLALSVPFFLWLRPHLGKMLVPVLLYILAIDVMVVGAASVLADPSLAMGGRLLAFVGAVAFFLSDTLVARHRFVKSEYLNRAIGLPLYYGGQFLIAFSIGALYPV